MTELEDALPALMISTQNVYETLNPFYAIF